MLKVAAEAGDDDDLMTQVRLCAGRALLLATRRTADEAVALAREGIALAGETEYVYLRGDSLLALGEVLRSRAVGTKRPTRFARRPCSGRRREP